MTLLSSYHPSSKSFSKSKTSRARSGVFKAIILAELALLAAVVVAPGYKLVSWNHTPSMPEGLYLRSVLESPAKGKAVVVVPSPVAADMMKEQGMDPEKITLLKPLAAGPGDHVCVTDELRINDKYVAPVYSFAPTGKPTPKWDGCRKLEEDEWFTYAPRIWNSVDGRVTGPVKESAIIGVYRPVWVWDWISDY